MIVFIAMVLVAGVAASVLIQTSNQLESQAMTTGSETIQEVSGGLAVADVSGKIISNVDGLAFTIRARAGSPKIDLNHSIIILSEGDKKVVLRYAYDDIGHFNLTLGNTGKVFGYPYSDLTNTEFGIAVVEDVDSSVTFNAPVINGGDKVILYIDVNDCFSRINKRSEVFGYIYPEYGSPAVISFNTGASYNSDIIDFQ